MKKNIVLTKLQSGFSLVELMVAMLVSLFLTAGIFSMFTMSSTNVTTTSQFNQLQESGRIGLALMQRDVSQLGFMADMTGTDFVLGVNTQVNALAIAAGNDCIGGGANNATFPNNQAAHFRRLWGYESGVGGQSLACLSGVLPNTDVLQIKRLIGPSVVAAALNSSRYYMATTANQAVIFAGDQPAPALPNARIWEYQHHVYFIENDNGVPVLMRRTLGRGGMKSSTSYEQLVEGVENMRIMYGFDSDGNNTADSFMPAQNVTSLMWDNEVFQRLVAIRIYLLVRSIEEDPSYTNNVTYTLGDKQIVAGGDGFRRKVVMTTVVLENPVLI
ncbi:PilW family protein [Shewanella schlegeliana]|uniref:PilW family protein n=1 Tax=Shewanella schlegeliana TaxID=190308 RepID=A0ABS1SUX0_9GAMM|nr:PilW family protein [Shewanella schlegeliana]MBL4912130.1 PilW family protein [Shewanella schlegeliana]MCL1110784.1 PilW family protein [Shewanella schlegeliana]GIU22921.1 type IV minor pilin protein PilW [Shewanella schlegeliana]